MQPKTNRSRRTISLPPSVITRLRAHRMDPDTYGHAFHRLAEKSGVPNVRPHDLRHEFATTLLSAGVNVKVVSGALGHALGHRFAATLLPVGDG